MRFDVASQLGILLDEVEQGYKQLPLLLLLLLLSTRHDGFLQGHIPGGQSLNLCPIRPGPAFAFVGLEPLRLLGWVYALALGPDGDVVQVILDKEVVGDADDARAAHDEAALLQRLALDAREDGFAELEVATWEGEGAFFR